MRRRMIVMMSVLLTVTPLAAAEMEPAAVMEEVVVTAGRVAETVQEQTMSVQVISEEEIKASPARDLGELLAERGVGYIQKYPGALTTASIRGFKTNAQQSDLLGYTLVLLNGRRAGTGNLAMILTRNIERIEIIRGPGAVQYGSAALGGVINVITRKGAGPLSGEAFAAAGSFDFAEGGALVAGDAEAFDYSVSYAASTKDDYKTSRGVRYRNTGFDSKQTLSLNLGYRPADLHRIGLTLNGTRISRAGAPNYLSLNDLDNYRDSEYQAIDLAYDGESQSGALAWKIRLFETEIEDISFDPVGSNPTFWDDGGISFESKVDQQGALAQLSSEFGAVRLVTGVDWYDYDVESTFAPNRSTFENLAGFVLVKSRCLDERLIVDLGLRYDDAEVEVVTPSGKKVSHDNIVTSFGVAYLLNDNLKLRARYGEGFKMPGADQLAADYESFGVSYVGNPDLNPESSRTYEAGVEYVDGPFRGALGYFFTRFEDKITRILIPGGYTWVNSGKSELSGIEAEFAGDFALLGRVDLRLQPYLNGTFFDRYRDLDANEDLKYLNELNAAYGARLLMPREFSARLNFAYHGRKWIEDWETVEVSGWMAPLEVVELGGYTVVDFSLSKQLLDSRCSLTAHVNNLFDKDYAYVKGYPMPGRNLQVSLNYRF